MENINRLKEIYNKVLNELGYEFIGDDFDSIRILDGESVLESHTKETDTAWFTTFYKDGKEVVSITRDGIIRIITPEGTSILIFYDNRNTKEVNFTIMGNSNNTFNGSINVAISDLTFSINTSVFDGTISSHMRIIEGIDSSYVDYGDNKLSEIAIIEEDYLEEIDYFIKAKAGQLQNTLPYIYPAVVLCIQNMMCASAIRRNKEKRRRLEEAYRSELDRLNDELEKLYEKQLSSVRGKK